MLTFEIIWVSLPHIGSLSPIECRSRIGSSMMETELLTMGHLPDRRSFIGGSDARTIMGDDAATLLRLWREKRGGTEPEDLSGNLIVHLGLVTESLNRIWYERNTGPEYSTQCARCLFAFFGGLKLPEAHARPSPIFVDEFDPGAFQSGLDFRTGSASAT